MVARHLRHIVYPFKTLLFLGVSREVHPEALTPSGKRLGACAGLCRWLHDPDNASIHIETTINSFVFLLAIVSSFILGSCGSYSGVAKSASLQAAYTIGGTVSGLSGMGLVLQDNLGNNLSVTTNGSFMFTTAITSGGAYSVTVLTQPASPAQTCAVTALCERNGRQRQCHGRGRYLHYK